MIRIGSPIGRSTALFLPYPVPQENLLSHKAGGKTTYTAQLGASIAHKGGGKTTIAAQFRATLVNSGGGRSSLSGVTTARPSALSNKGGGKSALGGRFLAALTNQGGGKSTLSGILKQYTTLTNKGGGKTALSGIATARLAALSNKAGGVFRAYPSGYILLAHRAGGKSTLSAKSFVLASLAHQAGGKSTLSGKLAQFAAISHEGGGKTTISGHLAANAFLRHQAGGVTWLSANQFEIWVVNIATGAVSRYTALPNCSFARLGNRLLIASASGLFELTGTTDNGSPIVSSVTTGKMNFGSHFLKRVDSLNIFYESSGALSVAARTMYNGELTNSFSGVVLPASSPREGVIKLGQGQKSQYWQFVVSNQGGASFKIDAIDIHPIILSRRR